MEQVPGSLAHPDGVAVVGWLQAMAVSVALARAPRLVTIAPDASLRQAAQLMWSEGVSALVVGTPGHRISLLTERDVTRAVADGQPLDTGVLEVASPDPATIDIGATVMAAAVAMLHLGVRHLVVVDRLRAVGLVSMREVMAELLRPGGGPVGGGLVAR